MRYAFFSQRAAKISRATIDLRQQDAKLEEKAPDVCIKFNIHIEGRQCVDNALQEIFYQKADLLKYF
jgi:hypothetical protein